MSVQIGDSKYVFKKIPLGKCLFKGNNKDLRTTSVSIDLVFLEKI